MNFRGELPITNDKKRCFFIVVCWIIVSSFLYAHAVAANAAEEAGREDLKRLIVTPVKNETKEKDFNKLLVMDGIRNLVAQAFYETGKFTPIESVREARSNIKGFTGGNLTDANNTSEIIPHTTVKPIIKKLTKSRTRTMLWGFSRAVSKIQIEINLEINDIDGTNTTVYGKGSAKMKSYGVLFQIRDDKISFDETGVGKALKQAVYDAVERYITVISKDKEKANDL